MTPLKANLINSISLIGMGLWGYFQVSSATALIPVVFGVLLLVCYFIASAKPALNKAIAHVAVLLTLLILFALVGMRLPKSLATGGSGLIRVLVMIATSGISIVVFIKSFIEARKRQG